MMVEQVNDDHGYTSGANLTLHIQRMNANRISVQMPQSVHIA